MEGEASAVSGDAKHELRVRFNYETKKWEKRVTHLLFALVNDDQSLAAELTVPTAVGSGDGLGCIVCD